ncbi:unnamed protein product, partial [Hapterophycus canaliculatus]
SVASVTGDLYREGGGIGRFWRGFIPSLILTCNPAINYTAFDMLKALWLRRRRPDPSAAAAAAAAAAASAGVAANARGGGAPGFLNPLEAFLVAAAAKSLATLVTYPLIRAKVVLMTSPSSTPAPDGDGHGDDDDDDDGVPTYPPRSAKVAAESGRREREGSASVGDLDDDDAVARNATAAAADDDDDGRGDRGGEGDGVEGSAESVAGSTSATATAAAAVRERRGGGDARGMGKVLLDIFGREGLGGLYAGCGAQV